MELALVLLLVGMGVAELVPAARRQLDRMAVLAAREEIAGLLHQAREEALARGASELVLRVSPSSADLLADGDTLDGTILAEDYGVTLYLSRGRGEARLVFGPLGLGRVSSQTLRFRRGEEEALLVVSSLGRVARR